jgi:hypothetical protein
MSTAPPFPAYWASDFYITHSPLPADGYGRELYVLRPRRVEDGSPSGPQTTASPSSAKDLARSFAAVLRIAGYRPLQS